MSIKEWFKGPEHTQEVFSKKQEEIGDIREQRSRANTDAQSPAADRNPKLKSIYGRAYVNTFRREDEARVQLEKMNLNGLNEAHKLNDQYEKLKAAGDPEAIRRFEIEKLGMTDKPETEQAA